MTSIKFHPGTQLFHLHPSTPHDVVKATKLGFRGIPGTSDRVTPDAKRAAIFFGYASDDYTRQLLNTAAYSYLTSWCETDVHGMEPITPSDMPNLYPYQRIGAKLMYQRRFNLLGFQPGLGKTPTTAAVMNMRRSPRVLVAAPSFLIHNWMEELEKWMTYSLPFYPLNKPRMSVPDGPGVYLLPYGRATSYWNPLMASGRFDMLAMDEIQMLKNPEAKRSQVFWGTKHGPGLIQFADTIQALSGSPTPNNPWELFPLLNGIGQHVLGGRDATAYKSEFTESFKAKNGREVVSGNMASQALNADLRCSEFMLRPDEERVLPDMPELTISPLQLHVTPEVANLVKRENELHDIITTSVSTAYTHEQLAEIKGEVATVRRLIGTHKAPQIAEYSKYLLNTGLNRLVIFAYHRDVIDLIADMLPKAVKVAKIFGGISMDRRHQLVSAFQSEDQKPHVIIGQLQACGVGLNFTKARRAIVGESDWVWDTTLQAIKRLHRISQNWPVQADILGYPHALEFRIAERSQEKRVTNHDIYNVDLINQMAAEA